jgi:hypothetical protein
VFVEVIETHEALLVAVHVQSGVVDTVTVPLAPLAGADCIEFEAVIWHFTGDGPTVSVDDEQAAAAIASSAHASQTSRFRAFVEPVCRLKEWVAVSRPAIAAHHQMQARCPTKGRRLMDLRLPYLPGVSDLTQSEDPIVLQPAGILAANLRDISRRTVAECPGLGAGDAHFATTEPHSLRFEAVEGSRQRANVHTRPDGAGGVRVESLVGACVALQYTLNAPLVLQAIRNRGFNRRPGRWRPCRQ